MSRIQEHRASVVTATGAPTYINRWSNNNWQERSWAPNATSYAAFPSANYTNSSSFVGPCFPAAKASAPAATSSPKADNTNKLMAFHSSTQWREYFQASKNSNKLVVIYFTAIWCGPCRSIEPTIKELAAKYTGVDLVKLDVDVLFKVSGEFGIQTMPTFVFMKNGKEVDRVIGARTMDLQRKIQKHMA